MTSASAKNSPLRRSALIDTGHDRRITAGATINDTIDEYLATADLVLLLISPDFINSDYCYQKEMRTALQRHRKGQARVIPIILRPVDWQETPIGRLLATPRDAEPVTKWHDATTRCSTSPPASAALPRRSAPPRRRQRPAHYLL